MAKNETYNVWGGPLAGIGSAVLAIVVVVWVLQTGADWWFVLPFVAATAYTLWLALFVYAYEGTLSAEGDLWFKSPLREWRCRVEDVDEISAHSQNQGGSRWFTIRTAVGSFRIARRRGEPIVNAIRSSNPEISYREESWLRW